MCHAKKDCKGKIFGDAVTDNQMMCVGSCHAIRQEADEIVEIPGVHADRSEGNHDDETTGVTLGDKTNMDKRVRFADDVSNYSERDAIDAVARSRDRFSKRDQLKADMVRRVQHVAACPSDATLIYSFSTNGIKNNPLTKRDVETCDAMLGCSKHLCQGKTHNEVFTANRW